MRNTFFKACLPCFLAAAAVLAGCATSSSPTAGASPSKLGPHTLVTISSDALPNRNYQTVGHVEVMVKKPTVFDRDPTQENANEALTEKARSMGADAVINVTYFSGVDAVTSWAYMEAKGVAVRLAR